MLRTKRGGWPYSHPPNTDFGLNTVSPQAQGLEPWWPMLASRGALVLRDLGGRGLDGVLVDGPEWVSSAEVGWGLQFDGTDDYVNCGATGLNLPQITVAVWVRRDAGVTGWDVVIAKGDSAWSLNFDGGLDINWEIVTDDWHSVSSNDGLTLGRWYHVVATYDGTTQRIYLDGLQANSAVPGGGGIAANAEEIWIGANSELRARWPPITVAEVRIYRYALSPSLIWDMTHRARWELCRPRIPRLWAMAPTVARIPRPPAAYNVLMIY